jgi:hypothetical protein
MDNAKFLMAILNVLDRYWGKFTSDMTQEQLNELQNEISTLKTKMTSTKDYDQVNVIAKEFFDNLSGIGALKDLADIGQTQMRSGSMPEREEDIKIKIINYCVMLDDKIAHKKAVKVK